MSPFELILAGIAICLSIAVVALSSMLIGAYKAVGDMADDLVKARRDLDAALARVAVFQRMQDGPARMPFWGVRRGS